ncbi:MAG: DNA mismatch repair protein MutS2 [Maribacter sp.]|jgi:DNA mismatch repair protein MutS2
MELLPNDILETLEFDKVLHILERKCMGEPGRLAIRKLKPRTELFILDRLLKEVKEYTLSLEENKSIPMGNYVDISKELKMLGIEGALLPIEEILSVKNQLWVIRDIFRFFHVENQRIYPTIFDIIRPLSFDENLIGSIEKVIDEEGNIKPTASPELMQIRKATGSKHRELNKMFANSIQNFKNKGWLTDSVESFRNGRRVLSVPAEHKRKIRGIIHDESATGKTAFIEPDGIIDINNDLFDLSNEEKREIARVLRALCAKLRPYVPAMRKYQALLVRMDEIQAKARLAIDLDADLPKIKDEPKFGFRRSFHPLLLLKNKAEGKKTVPFDLMLHGKNRVLMLSGPNAGGKSISMKAAGLLQMMLQSGMLVPSDPESEYGIFHSFFADIGDQQSLEDDLSTYSSRLTNMKGFLNHADERTFALIDEFGSGTDPQIGGAIAEAILKALHQKKVFAFVTTHYSNLKVFAFKTPGIVNGAMRFDKDTLSPSYELLVGKPGSSYGFEIANKIGLDKKVIAYAKKKIGKNERAVDQLLIDLQREKQELEEKLDAAQTREKNLDQLVKNYERMAKELDVGRKKLKLDVKEWNMQEAARENKLLEKVVREIREEKNLEKAKKMAEEARMKRQTNTRAVHNLKEDIYHSESQKQDRAIVVGDFVKLKSGGATGKVTRIDKKKVEIEMGLLNITTHMRDLVLANEPLTIHSGKRVKSNMIEKRAEFNSKLDLRGLRRDEALQLLEKYMDEALMTGVDVIEIVHGKGDGILRKAVKQKLREYSAVTNVSHPVSNKGGDGVTLVELD